MLLIAFTYISCEGRGIDMEIKQLQYFIAIVEEGQITAAAKRLHMAQPPLSQQLKNLEEELNATLIERNTRKIQLTEIGRHFYLRAKQLVELNTTIKKEIIDYTNGYEGTVMLGITPTVTSIILKRDLLKFNKKYPNINFEIFEGDTNQIIDLVKKRIIDIGFVYSPFNTQGLQCIERPPEPMVALMLPELDWNGISSCCISDFDNRDLIIYRRYEPLLSDVFSSYRINPRIICKTDRSFTTIRCAESGLGIAIVPESAKEIGSNNLICKTIQEDRLYTQPVAIWLHDHYLVKPAQAFLDYFSTI